MYFLLFIAVTLTVYIATFSKDFNEEDIGKAIPFMIICIILTFVLSIISSLQGG